MKEMKKNLTNFSKALFLGACLAAMAPALGFAQGPSDFNLDGVTDSIDIDLLVKEISTGGTDPVFDLNGDGMITLPDVTDPSDGWLTLGGAVNPTETGGNPFLLGDANLDGCTDGSDFIIWNEFRFTSTGAWTMADFNADGFTDGTDFIVWNDHAFQCSSVPEPGTLASIFVALLTITGLARKRIG